MFDFMKKAMLTGFGLALKTSEEIRDLARDFAEKGKLSEEEGQKFVDEMVEKYEETRSSFEEKVESAVKEGLAKADIAKKSEVEALKEEIAQLRQTLEELKNTTD